jgi:ADP-dependent NAD(P)H-hydrate dehydratase / NAD(P)H-hydrate epimerase
MRVGTASVMRNIDSCAINEIGIPGIVLMENASREVLHFLLGKAEDNFCIICSKGNNGGDGFALARQLFVMGKRVEVFLVGGDQGMSSDCRINYEAAKGTGIEITSIESEDGIAELNRAMDKCDLAVDAIFGTGLTRNVEGIYSSVIDAVNAHNIFVAAIDVPSGMNSDTGRIAGNCIKADATVTFELYKKGFLYYKAQEYTGEIVTVKIGIPEKAVLKYHNREYILDAAMIRDKVKVRDRYSHKGDFGRVLIIAGIVGYSGAAYICTTSAVRSGSGLVTLACEQQIRNILSQRLTEAMTISFEKRSKLEGHIGRSDAIAIGPGLGNSRETLELLRNVLENAKCPVVIDADGLNALECNLELLESRKCGVVITPHPGEMARLSGYEIGYIEENRSEVAKEFALKYGVIVLLKGYNTIITDGNDLFYNSTGSSAMASGGMGDCLTGIITSFIGQGYDTLTAACLAAYIHGYSGDVLSQELYSVNATHVMEEIPYAIKEIIDG